MGAVGIRVRSILGFALGIEKLSGNMLGSAVHPNLLKNGLLISSFPNCSKRCFWWRFSVRFPMNIKMKTQFSLAGSVWQFSFLVRENKGWKRDGAKVLVCSFSAHCKPWCVRRCHSTGQARLHWKFCPGATDTKVTIIFSTVLSYFRCFGIRTCIPQFKMRFLTCRLGQFVQ